MKVLVAQFMTESNANINTLCQIENYDLAFGEDCIDRMKCREVFEENNITLIPSLYADSGASGVIDNNTFMYFYNRIIQDIENSLSDLDGIFLHLHGASEVQGLPRGSGEQFLLKKIREVVGEYMPIAIVCDPHGNLSQEYVNNSTIIRSYRNTPHTDMEDTIQTVANLLVKVLKERNYIKPVYRKLPLILGGEQSVSSDEPVRSINVLLDSIEEDERIMSCSWHVGYLRHDTEYAGCGVVVIPSDSKYHEYAEEKADEIAKYIMNRRHDFHYTGITMEPNSALKSVVEHEGTPVFLTDSGDNVTSGSHGGNTFVLQQFLKEEYLKDKKVLFAALHDGKTYNQLSNEPINAICKVELGMDIDSLTSTSSLEVKVLRHGELLGGFYETQHSNIVGKGVLVNIIGTNIDILITNCNAAFCEKPQFDMFGIEWSDYDIFVVKQGYIFPQLDKVSAYSVMSLTDGPTPQDTRLIPFKRIMRPMYPIDEI